MNDKQKEPRVLRPPWELVMNEMISVDLSITRWRGRTKLDFQSDLGLIDSTLQPNAEEFKTYQEALKKVIRGGQRSLLPPQIEKRLSRIERAARSALETLSFQAGGMFGNLMPKDNYAKFVARLTEQPYDEDYPERGSLRTDYFAMRDFVAEQREEIAAYTRRSHRNLAVVAWRLSEGLPITDERTAPEAWVEDYLERVIAALPSVQRIYDSFAFDWTMAEIPVPDEAVKQVKLDQLARAQKTLDSEIERLKQAQERLQSRAEYEALKEVERARYDAERAQLDKQMAEARLEREKVQRDLQIQKEIGERNRARIESAIAPALDEITSSVRKMLYESTLNALAAVRSNGKLPPQSAGAIKKLIERASDLNWTNDAQILTYLAQLREIATEMSSSTTGIQAEAALKEAAWQIRLDLSDLGVNIRSGRSLEFEALDIEIVEGEGRAERDQDFDVRLDLADVMEQRQERNPGA